MNSEEYIKKIETNLQVWFTKIGFVKINDNFSCFSRDEEKYYDEIVVSVQVYKNMISGTIQMFSRKIKIIESIWEGYKNEPLCIAGINRKTFGGDLIDNFLFDDKQEPKAIDNWGNWQNPSPNLVEKICEKVKSDYYNFVLPKLYEYSNIHKLDAIANGNDTTFSLGNEKLFRSLIISKLAGNSNYENIYSEWHLRLTNGIAQNPSNEKYKNYLWVIEQLHKKLADVKPLDNPVLI